MAGVPWGAGWQRAPPSSPHKAGRTVGSSFFSHSLQKACSPGASGHRPVHWGHPSGRGGAGGAGRAPRLAHCGRPPHSADWRFSRLAPCGPDSPNTSLGDEQAPVQTRTHSSSLLRLQARAQRTGEGSAGGEPRLLESVQGSQAWFSLARGDGHCSGWCTTGEARSTERGGSVTGPQEDIGQKWEENLEAKERKTAWRKPQEARGPPSTYLLTLP